MQQKFKSSVPQTLPWPSFSDSAASYINIFIHHVTYLFYSTESFILPNS